MTSESEIQRSILEYLRRQFPNACIRKLHITPMLVGPGRRVPSPIAGFPDILMIHKGQAIFFECKRPGVKRKDQQIQADVQDKLTRAGAWVFVVHSLEEAQEAGRGLK